MSRPLSLDEVANTMRDIQANPKSNTIGAQTYWDSKEGVFKQKSPGEQLGEGDLSINGGTAKDPYFA